MSYKCNVKTQGCLSMGPEHGGWRIRNMQEKHSRFPQNNNIWQISCWLDITK